MKSDFPKPEPGEPALEFIFRLRSWLDQQDPPDPFATLNREWLAEFVLTSVGRPTETPPEKRPERLRQLRVNLGWIPPLGGE